MSRRLRTVVFSLCAILSVAASTHGQERSALPIQGIVLEMSIVEMKGSMPPEGIEKIERGKAQLDQLVQEGKARILTNLLIRTRPGENFHAKIGQRVPVQIGTLPAFRASDPSRESAQPRAASLAVSQITYENTGLIVQGSATAVSAGVVDIRLNLEVTGTDSSTGRLTPTFTLRTLSDVVRIKIGETAVLMGLTQPEQPTVSDTANETGVTGLSRGSFIVLLTVLRRTRH